MSLGATSSLATRKVRGAMNEHLLPRLNSYAHDTANDRKTEHDALYTFRGPHKTTLPFSSQRKNPPALPHTALSLLLHDESLAQQNFHR